MQQKALKAGRLWQWRGLEYIAIFIVFFTPLYFNMNHWSPFGLPKTLLVSFGVLSMVILYAWGAIVDENFSLKINWLQIVLFVFLVTMTISSIFGLDPSNSFFGNLRYPTNLIYVYLVSIFALFIGFLIRSNKQFLRQILLFSFLSSLVVAIVSYSNTSIFFLLKDYSSTLGNSSYTGGYLLLNVCIGLGLFFNYKKLWLRAFIALGTLFLLFSPVFFNPNIWSGQVTLLNILHKPLLLLGVANGAAIGLASSIIVIICLSLIILSSKKFLKVIAVSVLCLFLLGTVYTSHLLTDNTSSLHKTYLAEKGENRFIAWDIARQSLSGRVLLGSGFNNYYYNFQKDFTADIYGKKAEMLYAPHNVFWEYTSNTGILGLLSYLSLLAGTFFFLFKGTRYDHKQEKIMSIVLMGALVGYFIQNLFIFDTAVTYLIFFLIVGIAIGTSQEVWNFKLLFDLKYWLSGLIIFFSFISLILFVLLPWQESVRWQQVQASHNLSDTVRLRESLQSISLFGGVDDSAFLAGQTLDFYIKNIDQINDKSRPFFLADIDSIVSQTENDQKRQPDDLRAYFILGKLLTFKLVVLGSLDEDIWQKANSYLDKTIEINPQNPEVYLAKAQLYIFKKDYASARIETIKAINLVPTLLDAYEMANKLQIISPDADFKTYVLEMKNKYVIIKNL